MTKLMRTFSQFFAKNAIILTISHNHHCHNCWIVLSPSVCAWNMKVSSLPQTPSKPSPRFNMKTNPPDPWFTIQCCTPHPPDPPEIELETDRVHSGENKEAHLTCLIQGNPMPTVSESLSPIQWSPISWSPIPWPPVSKSPTPWLPISYSPTPCFLIP